MGYELHITRNEEWWNETTGGGISLSEWFSYVESDPTMRMDNSAEVDLPNGSILHTENEGLAVWVEYAGNEDRGNQAWFAFQDNSIVVKNPDQDILTKMLAIATILNALVIGDEGEEYQSPIDHGVPARAHREQNTTTKHKSWWKFW